MMQKCTTNTGIILIMMQKCSKNTGIISIMMQKCTTNTSIILIMSAKCRHFYDKNELISGFCAPVASVNRGFLPKRRGFSLIDRGKVTDELKKHEKKDDFSQYINIYLRYHT
jgi:hypothetical protein